ncbi:MAG: hypothetical protein WCV79_03050 [Candidatus Paceibacterota bacterium]
MFDVFFHERNTAIELDPVQDVSQVRCARGGKNMSDAGAVDIELFADSV